jgi:hypothetical protein|tara:strand:+ start:3503 stop:3712 length:210 start_codon:yes stop_codon:yes gene_type:complete
MTVSELLEQLKDYDPNAVVTLMVQPNYPLECHIELVTSRSDIGSHAEVSGDVYIVQGSQIGYGTRKVWE